MLLQEDSALTRRGGAEWTSVDISQLTGGSDPARLALCLVDKRPVANYPTMILIGPVRMVHGLE